MAAPYAVWHGLAAIESSGDLSVLQSPDVTVTDLSTGSLATLYADRDGSTGKSNPFTAGTDGSIEFYANAGRYRVEATDGTNTATWENEPLSAPVNTEQTGLARWADMQASDLADLQSQSIPSSRISIYMQGRNSIGDGGEGVFTWDGSDLSTEVGNDEVTADEGDGGIYVAPDSDKTGSSGAWVRQDATQGMGAEEWYGGSGVINATDGGTDAYASDFAAGITPADGVQIVRNFQSANTTTTPTLDGKPITDLDGNVLWPGAVDRVHAFQYDSASDAYHVLDPHLFFNSDYTISVGSDGDYSTLNDAIDAVGKIRPLNESTLTINQLSGFVASEQLFFANQDYSWIRITSDDATVTVDRSALTDGDPDSTFSVISFLLAYDGATAPLIACHWDVDSSGTNPTNSRCVRARHGSMIFMEPNSGKLSGQVDRLAEISHGSTMIARLCSISNGLGIGVRISNGSIFHGANGIFSGNGDANVACSGGQAILNDTDMTNAGTNGIQCNTGGASAMMRGADVSGAGSDGIRCISGVVDFEGGTANNCASYGVQIDNGGYVQAKEATITGSPINVFIQGGGRFVADLNSDLSGATASGGGDGCVVAQEASVAHLNGANCSGGASYGVHGKRASVIDATNVDASPADGAQSNQGFRVVSGTWMAAHGGTGDLSQTANSLTADGVITQ